MPTGVSSGAMLSCTFGAAPSTLTAIRPTKLYGAMPIANIQDFAPTTNIAPFGMCSSILNPTVAAATTAALGVLTPQACIPATTAPWIMGSPAVMVDNMPALTLGSVCMCSYMGVIQITNAGQTVVDVGFGGAPGGAPDVDAMIADAQAQADAAQAELEQEIEDKKAMYEAMDPEELQRKLDNGEIPEDDVAIAESCL